MHIGEQFPSPRCLVKVPPLQLVELLANDHLRLNPTWVGVESNGFQSLIASLLDDFCRRHRRAPIPVVPVINSIKKFTRIAALDPWIAPADGEAVGKLRIKRNAGGELLVEQLQMFPDTDYHDDGPDALEGAISLLRAGLRGAVFEEPEEELVFV